MDRVQVYRGEVPYETDFLLAQQRGYEALGLALLDILGSSTLVSALGCSPTTPATLNVQVAPGRIYTKAVLDQNPIGQLFGLGGLAADTNSDHQILKQGLLRDTTTFAITPPATSGQSQVYLIQAQLQEVDDTAVSLSFYNTANPSSPITQNLSPARRDICALGLKAGTAATTGSQVAPTADSGWTPLWTITVANGQTTITAPNIAQASGAPFITALGSVPGKASTADILAGLLDNEYITPLGQKNAMVAQTLTDAATVNWNLAAGFRAKLTMTAAVGSTRVIGVPSNLQEGATGSVQFKQPASGGPCSATFATGWDFRNLGPPSSFSTAANKIDIVRFEVIDASTPIISASFDKSA